MATKNNSSIAEVVSRHRGDLFEDWMKEQMAASTLRPDLISEENLRRQSKEFMDLFIAGCGKENLADISTDGWKAVRDFLADLSRHRASQGFNPVETAVFIFSLKQPIFTYLGQEKVAEPEALLRDIWTVTALLDRLGMYTVEISMDAREQIIRRQQLEMIELSTPVVEIWEGILILPVIGTLDSARSQVIMENLLQSIVDTGSDIAIIDITGVPVVDTQVAQHLLKTVTAAKLMGAQCIISGIRPQIAQTMVHLGVTFDYVVTKASLADALALAFKQNNYVITRQ